MAGIYTWCWWFDNYNMCYAASNGEHAGSICGVCIGYDIVVSEAIGIGYAYGKGRVRTEPIGGV